MSCLNDLIEQQEIISKSIAKIKVEIFDEIRSTPIADVSSINDFCYEINLSKIRRNGIFSAEYYSSYSQATLIREAIRYIETADGFLSKLERIISDKYIIFGGNRHPINDTTIAILKKYI